MWNMSQTQIQLAKGMIGTLYDKYFKKNLDIQDSRVPSSRKGNLEEIYA